MLSLSGAQLPELRPWLAGVVSDCIQRGMLGSFALKSIRVRMNPVRRPVCALHAQCVIPSDAVAKLTPRFA
jgi:hypothetical protein